MGGRVLRFTVVCALVLGGLSSGLLAATGRGTTTTTIAAGASTAGLTAATTTTSTAREVLVFNGHGWGHGLGMSQWGAYGYARHGWTYDQILAHYYTGTTLGQAAVRTVRVLLADRRAVTLSSTVPWTVTDAGGTKTALDPGDVRLAPALVLDGAKAKPPLTFSAAQPLAVDGHAYRGRLTVAATPTRVQVVDVVGLEAYVKGVVPAEMPSGWSPEALKAQAVATRSYALANLAKKGDFDLYADSRSQVYGGVAAESPTASAAVDATRGQVVLYAGKVADTLFHSTSGGRTASAADQTGRPVPYLVSVPDPYDTASPYHDWGPVLVDAARVQRLLKLPGPVQGVQPTPGGDGRVARALVTGPYGVGVTISGEQARLDLGLRSTWFTVGLLSLAPSAKTMTYGGAVSLAGTAVGVAAPSLEARVGTGPWQPAAELQPDPAGAFTAIVRPALTTRYRLASGAIRAGLARVDVAPLVTASVSATGATGSIRPALAGAAVQLQFSPDGAAWQTIGTTTTDAAGGFTVIGAGAAGSYRVRVAPGHGLAPGFSKTTGCC